MNLRFKTPFHSNKQFINPKFNIIAILKRQCGFTLVELLVVISIIAVLSVVGLTVYSSVSTSARDSRRKADIDAIAKAFETNQNITSGQYIPLATNQFVENALPRDPLSPTGCTQSGGRFYCYRGATTTNWTANCITNSNGLSTGNPNPSSTNNNWIVCACLESGGVYCKSKAR